MISEEELGLKYFTLFQYLIPQTILTSSLNISKNKDKGDIHEINLIRRSWQR